MNERVRAIVEEAQKVTPEERLELFDVLEATFVGNEGDGTPEAIEAAWIEEVERRIAEAGHNRTEFIDFKDVVARLRQLLR